MSPQVAFVLYQQSLSDALGSIGDVFTGLMSAAGAADQVFHLMDRQPQITPAGHCQPRAPRAPSPRHASSPRPPHRRPDAAADQEREGFVGSIEFCRVSLAYPSRPDSLVLRGISFSIQPGQVVALVGESGSGKSSCVALLERWYDPTDGCVLLDGAPIASYSHAALHRHMALVGQEPVLYARSIRDNISYGCEPYGWTPRYRLAPKACCGLNPNPRGRAEGPLRLRSDPSRQTPRLLYVTLPGPLPLRSGACLLACIASELEPALSAMRPA